MYTLSNEHLDVTILDPLGDQARLGTRYCSGGYIYQVTDRKVGVLLSGPGYPAEEPPPPFDGQGLPEAFPDPLAPGDGPIAPGTKIMVVGVGLVESVAATHTTLKVFERCAWTVTETAESIVMETVQRYLHWGLELRREVTLHNRTLASLTQVRNLGERPLSLRWFPHPFYPWYPGGECCKFNIPVTFPENPGYQAAESGFIQMKLDHPWTRAGHFQVMECTQGDRLVVLQKHPMLGLVGALCSYAPAFLPIWGNCNTFSFEPYHAMTVAREQASQWSITYDF